MDWPGGSWQNVATLAGTLAGAYVLVLWISVLVWTYRDIRDRSRDAAFQVVAVLLVLVFNLLGWLIYLILRPSETLSEAYARSLEEEALLQELEEQGICPSCKRYVTGEFIICPFCRTQLKESCGKCGRPLSFNWAACPYCTTTRGVVAAPSTSAVSGSASGGSSGRASAQKRGGGVLEEEEEEALEGSKGRRAASPETSSTGSGQASPMNRG